MNLLACIIILVIELRDLDLINFNVKQSRAVSVTMFKLTNLLVSQAIFYVQF